MAVQAGFEIMILIKNYKIYIEDDRVKNRFILEKINNRTKHIECVTFNTFKTFPFLLEAYNKNIHFAFIIKKKHISMMKIKNKNILKFETRFLKYMKLFYIKFLRIYNSVIVYLDYRKNRIYIFNSFIISNISSDYLEMFWSKMYEYSRPYNAFSGSLMGFWEFNFNNKYLIL